MLSEPGGPFERGDAFRHVALPFSRLALNAGKLVLASSFDKTPPGKCVKLSGQPLERSLCRLTSTQIRSRLTHATSICPADMAEKPTVRPAPRQSFCTAICGAERKTARHPHNHSVVCG